MTTLITNSTGGPQTGQVAAVQSRTVRIVVVLTADQLANPGTRGDIAALFTPGKGFHRGSVQIGHIGKPEADQISITVTGGEDLIRRARQFLDRALFYRQPRHVRHGKDSPSDKTSSANPRHRLIGEAF